MGNYAAVEDLKQWARIDDSADDTLLGLAIDAAEETVEDYVGDVFTDEGSATARVYATGDPCLVRTHFFSTTTGLVVATDTGGDGTFDTTWASGDYQVEPLNALVSGRSHSYYLLRAIEVKTFPVTREARVEVTARWGWQTVPDRVKQATLIQAAMTYRRRLTPDGVMGIEGAGIRSVSRLPLDGTAQGLLAPYMNINRLAV